MRLFPRRSGNSGGTESGVRTFLVSARKVPKEADQRGATTADAPPLETPAALSDAFATEKADFYSVFWYTKASPYPGEAFCVGTQGVVEYFGKKGHI
jgi:hypothetical protein